MTFRNRIKALQRVLGVDDDGSIGPITLSAIEDLVDHTDRIQYGYPVRPSDESSIDARSLKNIETLIPRAQEPFKKFYLLATATAASMGCEYIAISGLRSMEEQAALYAKGRTAPGKKVTNARAGSSWHNFGAAVDFGVFRDGKYLDSSDPKLARRVHIACSKHAKALGIEWGGSWRTFKDIPHYQLTGGMTLATARRLHKGGKWA